MLRRVTVACTFVLAVATGASAQSGFSATSTVQSPPGTQTSSSAAHPKRLDRRRRPSSATLDCGLFRPARCSATVSGRSAATGAARITSRASATSAISPARLPSGSRTARSSSGRSSSIPAIDRDLVPLFINNADVGGIVDRDPRVHQRWTGDNVGDFYVGAKINLWSEFQPEAGGARLPRHGEAADRRQRRGRLDRASRFQRRLHRQQGTAAQGRVVGVCRLRVPGQAGRLRHSGRGASGGAWGRASRPGPPSAPRSNWSDRCPPTTRRPSPPAWWWARTARSRRRSRRPRT